jgi:dimethylargininase
VSGSWAARVRGVPDAYVRATRDTGMAGGDIDVALARIQHAAYVAALASLGIEVRALPADEAHPDCVFIEDTAVVARGRAVVLRSAHPAARVGGSPGAGHGRGGAQSGTDGGDVLRMGDRAWVGGTVRTDDLGIAALGRAP